jgi:hypothetical protein
MTTARELLQRIRELHNRSPQVLSGDIDSQAFWSDLEDCLREVDQAAVALHSLIPGEETIPRTLEALREGIRWELALNRALFPAVQSREPADTIQHHMVSLFGIVSGDILDRLFCRILVLVEIIGVLDGSVDFPEESYMTYQELRERLALPIAILLDEDDDLDA